MNKRKETVAKILTLLDGLSYNEAGYILEKTRDELTRCEVRNSSRGSVKQIV